MKVSFFALLAGFLLQACTSIPSARLHNGRFPVSGISIEKFRKGHWTNGQPLDGPFASVARANFIRIAGKWADKKATQYTNSGTYYGKQKFRGWFVEVYPEPTSKERTAIMNAKDGYEADLGRTLNASARIYPRFERKSFGWGEGVSFFVQYQNDNTNYVPNNGMLTYEIHGLTNAGMYVRAVFGVTHPDLVEFGPVVRDHRDGDPADRSSPMRLDPHYRLVEQAPAQSFEPSLEEIDNFISTLEIRR